MQQPKSNRRRNAILAVLSLVVAIALIGFVAYTVGKGGSSGGGNPQQTVQVVQLTADLNAGAKIDRAQVTLAALPADTVPAGAYTDLNKVVGQYVAIGLPKGTVLQPSLIATAPVAAVPLTPPPDVPEGHVALSVPIDELHGAGGYIRQDDHVDILVDTTGNGTLRYVFQDVHVLRVGSASQNGTASSPSLVLLDLPRADAQALAFVLNGRDTGATIVRFVLRPRDDFGKGPLPDGTISAPPTGEQTFGPQNWDQTFGH